MGKVSGLNSEGVKRVDQLKVIYVFIASPGDVQQARDSVRAAVDLVNDLVAKDLGFIFESVGWEDVPPGKRDRAQEVINPYVDKAHIFIGLLHQRFGQPTGVAESGTEEEFNRFEKRWREENPKPEIWVWFKTITDPQRVSDPGVQLSRVLEFKKRIGQTVFYKEFTDEHELQNDVARALASWLRLQKTDEIPTYSLSTLTDQDKDLLAAVILGDADGSPVDRSRNAARLIEHHILSLVEGTNDLAPVQTLESFVTITRHLFSSHYQQRTLRSKYYSSSLDRYLSEILMSRHKVQITGQSLDAIKILMKLSPRASANALFGDTTPFDNLAKQVENQKMNATQRKQAEEFAREILIQGLVIQALQDLTVGESVHEIDGQRITGVVAKIRLAGSFEDTQAFQFDVVMPLITVRAGAKIEKGEMVFGPPVMHAESGRVFLCVEEYELAVREYDRALSATLSPEKRSGCLNNKGIALERMGRIEEAVRCFEEAVTVDPSLPQPADNLNRLKSKDEPK